YVDAVRRGRSPRAGEERLTPEARRFEALALSLRTPAGVPAEALDDDGLDGLVERTGGRAVLTVRGRLLANVVTGRLHGGGVRGSAGTMPGMLEPDADTSRLVTAVGGGR
ncbi:MAG: hypothetical protein JO368_01710, partial [Acidimicrobiales bacterium]|nr:hypothetical protein [Acidimicrobiales bacterium]